MGDRSTRNTWSGLVLFHQCNLRCTIVNRVVKCLRSRSATQKACQLYPRGRSPVSGAIPASGLGCLRASAQSGRCHGRADLSSLWEKVNTKLSYPWTTEALADSLHVSVGNLHRICREIAECAPMEYGHAPAHAPGEKTPYSTVTFPCIVSPRP